LMRRSTKKVALNRRRKSSFQPAISIYHCNKTLSFFCHMLILQSISGN
jgi:hypothetical protein